MKKCDLCKSSGIIWDWPNGALSWGTVPCPECKMSVVERAEYYKNRRRVKRDGDKLVEHEAGWPQ